MKKGKKIDSNKLNSLSSSLNNPIINSKREIVDHIVSQVGDAIEKSTASPGQPDSNTVETPSENTNNSASNLENIDNIVNNLKEQTPDTELTQKISETINKNPNGNENVNNGVNTDPEKGKAGTDQEVTLIEVEPSKQINSDIKSEQIRTACIDKSKLKNLGLSKNIVQVLSTEFIDDFNDPKKTKSIKLSNPLHHQFKTIAFITDTPIRSLISSILTDFINKHEAEIKEKMWVC